MRTHDVLIDGAPYSLRITIAAQERLSRKFGGEHILDTITSAVTDPVRMMAVLDEALHFKGSDTPKTFTGADLYDGLVDEGLSGQVETFGFLLDVAEASGLVTREKADKLLEIVRNADAADIAETENPTPAPAEA